MLLPYLLVTLMVYFIKIYIYNSCFKYFPVEFYVLIWDRVLVWAAIATFCRLWCLNSRPLFHNSGGWACWCRFWQIGMCGGSHYQFSDSYFYCISSHDKELPLLFLMLETISSYGLHFHDPWRPLSWRIGVSTNEFIL